MSSKVGVLCGFSPVPSFVWLRFEVLFVAFDAAMCAASLLLVKCTLGPFSSPPDEVCLSALELFLLVWSFFILGE